MRLFEVFDCVDTDTELMEVRAVRKKVVRKGKVIRKRDCPPGYRLVGTRCVRQTSAERIKRKRAGKRAARKSKSARRRNIKRAMRIRKRRHLKRVKF